MATQQSTLVYVNNQMGGNAWILLFHENSSNGTQSGSWQAGSGDSVGPLTVLFETGIGSQLILDYWSVLVHVQDGPNAGFYINSSTWKENQLTHNDEGAVTLAVSPTSFDVNLATAESDSMTKLAPASPITNVFVLMLENHSFDNVFAMSGIQGITAATTSNENSYNGTIYNVQSSAPVSMPTDPGHEFLDVFQQLCLNSQWPTPNQVYPTPNNAGFAENYATSTTEGPPAPPPAEDIGDIMACFATPTQLQVLYQLATQFAVCDHWFSSIPGPTWPNRFFVHGASSSGLDTSPTNQQMAGWEAPGGGFKYPNGSIYDALDNANIPYRLYNDSTGLPFEMSAYSDDPQNGNPAGAIPQASALSGVTLLDFWSVSNNLANDLQGPYPWPYTFIEPNYGDVVSGSYAGGSSQHPMDDIAGGEALISAVYNAIRNSPYWNTSLLIIIYDEHGGFYDSVPPGVAVEPGDNWSGFGLNVYGFLFNQYGVRIPAVIVSPLIAAGTVDHTLYDHTSVLATIEQMWGLSALTQRDGQANNVLHLLSQTDVRTDTPASLNAPRRRGPAARPRMTDEERAAIDAQPLPERGNLVGALGIAMKTDAEISGDSAGARARFEALRTRGDARAYIADVMAKVRAIQQQQRNAARRPSNPA